MCLTVKIYNISNKEIKKLKNNIGCTFILPTSETDRKIKKDNARTIHCVIVSISPDTIEMYTDRASING